MTLRHVVHKLVYDHAAGVAGVLDYLNIGRQARMSMQLLMNKINFNSESHTLNIQEAESVIDRVDGNFDVAAYFASKCHAVVIKLPVDIESDMALLDLFMSAMMELGDVSREFKTAYADGSITKKEFKKIAREIDDVIAKLLEFKAGIERVVID